MAGRHPVRERKRCLEILGVPEGSTDEEIKKAYKKAALRFHPDKNDSKDAKEKFQEISYAYKYLTEGPSAMGGDHPGEGDGIPMDILTRLFPWLLQDLFGGGFSPFGGGFSSFGGSDFFGMSSRSSYMSSHIPFFMDSGEHMIFVDDNDDTFILNIGGRNTYSSHSYRRERVQPSSRFGKQRRPTPSTSSSRPKPSSASSHSDSNFWSSTKTSNIFEPRTSSKDSASEKSSSSNSSEFLSSNSSSKQTTCDGKDKDTSPWQQTSENSFTTPVSSNDKQPWQQTSENLSTAPVSGKKKKKKKKKKETLEGKDVAGSHDPEAECDKTDEQSCFNDEQTTKIDSIPDEELKTDTVETGKTGTMETGKTGTMEREKTDHDTMETGKIDTMETEKQQTSETYPPQPKRLNKKERRKKMREQLRKEKGNSEVRSENEGTDARCNQVTLEDIGVEEDESLDDDSEHEDTDMTIKEPLVNGRKSRRMKRNEKRKQKIDDDNIPNINRYNHNSSSCENRYADILPQSSQEEEEMLRLALEMSKNDMQNKTRHSAELNSENAQNTMPPSFSKPPYTPSISVKLPTLDQISLKDMDLPNGFKQEPININSPGGQTTKLSYSKHSMENQDKIGKGFFEKVYGSSSETNFHSQRDPKQEDKKSERCSDTKPSWHDSIGSPTSFFSSKVGGYPDHDFTKTYYTKSHTLKGENISDLPNVLSRQNSEVSDGSETCSIFSKESEVYDNSRFFNSQTEETTYPDPKHDLKHWENEQDLRNNSKEDDPTFYEDFSMSKEELFEPPVSRHDPPDFNTTFSDPRGPRPRPYHVSKETYMHPYRDSSGGSTTSFGSMNRSSSSCKPSRNVNDYQFSQSSRNQYVDTGKAYPPPGNQYFQTEKPYHNYRKEYQDDGKQRYPPGNQYHDIGKPYFKPTNKYHDTSNTFEQINSQNAEESSSDTSSPIGKPQQFLPFKNQSYNMKSSYEDPSVPFKRTESVSTKDQTPKTRHSYTGVYEGGSLREKGIFTNPVSENIIRKSSSNTDELSGSKRISSQAAKGQTHKLDDPSIIEFSIKQTQHRNDGPGVEQNIPLKFGHDSVPTNKTFASRYQENIGQNVRQLYEDSYSEKSRPGFGKSSTNIDSAAASGYYPQTNIKVSKKYGYLDDIDDVKLPMQGSRSSRIVGPNILSPSEKGVPELNYVLAGDGLHIPQGIKVDRAKSAYRRK